MRVMNSKDYLLSNIYYSCSVFLFHGRKMSSLSFIITLLVLGVAVKAEEKYSTKWDNINVKEILESDRLLKNYFKCLNDEGSCTPEGADLKRHLPDALKSECSKCSEKQKENTETVINFLIEKRQEMWKTLQQKYDPDHTFYNKHFSSTSESSSAP